MGHGNQRPEIELVQAFMPALVTSTLMMIRSKMNELAWRYHSPIISRGGEFLPQGQLTP